MTGEPKELGQFDELANPPPCRCTLTELLSDVVAFVGRAVPTADGTAVTLLHPHNGQVQVQSASTTADFVIDVDVLQHEVFHEGPSLTCIRREIPIVSASLESDERWPGFGPLVAGLGVHSALSLPLVTGGRLIGVVTCLAFDRGAFRDDAVRPGVSISASAAATVSTLLTGARHTTEQLDRVVVGRKVIDQAVGLLCARSGCDADQAFDGLVRASREQDVKLAVVARDLLDESTQHTADRHW